MGVRQYYRIAVVDAIQLTKDSIEDVKKFLGDAFLRVDKPSHVVVWFKPCYNAQYVVGIHEGSYLLRHPDGSFSDECQELFERVYKEAETEEKKAQKKEKKTEVTE